MKSKLPTKKQLVIAFISHLENELGLLKQAALAAHDAATNDESRPENQYDTRALEASYLAGAQAQRVAEIHEVIAMFRGLQLKSFAPNDEVDSTALVELILDGKSNTVFMLPKGGGVSIECESVRVQIVSPNSALGEALVGLAAGDSAEIEVGNRVRKCEVLSVQ